MNDSSPYPTLRLVRSVSPQRALTTITHSLTPPPLVFHSLTVHIVEDPESSHHEVGVLETSKQGKTNTVIGYNERLDAQTTPTFSETCFQLLRFF